VSVLGLDPDEEVFDHELAVLARKPQIELLDGFDARLQRGPQALSRVLACAPGRQRLSERLRRRRQLRPGGPMTVVLVELGARDAGW